MHTMGALTLTGYTPLPVSNPVSKKNPPSSSPGVDFTKTGSNDIVVAREDGQLEVYDVDETGQLQQVEGGGTSMRKCGGSAAAHGGQGVRGGTLMM